MVRADRVTKRSPIQWRHTPSRNFDLGREAGRCHVSIRTPASVSHLKHGFGGSGFVRQYHCLCRRRPRFHPAMLKPEILRRLDFDQIDRE